MSPRPGSDPRLGKHPLRQDRLLLVLELDIESDARKPRHGNFELNGLDLVLVEPRPHFVHGLSKCSFRLFDAYRKGSSWRHLTLLSVAAGAQLCLLYD